MAPATAASNESTLGGEGGVRDPQLDVPLMTASLLERERQCMENYQPSNRSTGLYCPRIWDRWLCWNETLAGKTATAPCPDFIPGFFPTNFAHKECLETGEWFRHPDSNHIWSNYTTCVDHEDYEWRRLIISLYEIGYLISLCALVVSLAIFCNFKCLECARVRIHKHLFVSFCISNLLWLGWYRWVVDDAYVLIQNPLWCQIFHVFVQFFLLANYFWMFCEGFYLHTLIVLAYFRPESQLLKGFYVFGWFGPILPISLYVFLRAREEDKTCWVEQSSWSHVLSIPVCLCLILSLGFLINIVRVLLSKLKDNQKNFSSALRRNSSIGAIDNQHSLKKAVRATLILIPLLGLHYLLTPFRPDPGSKRFEYIYEVVAAATSSLQGFCVSLLFCFCNSEVLNVCRRKFCSRMTMEDKSPTHRVDNSCAPTNRCDETEQRNERNDRPI